MIPMRTLLTPRSPTTPTAGADRRPGARDVRPPAPRERSPPARPSLAWGR